MPHQPPMGYARCRHVRLRGVFSRPSRPGAGPVGVLEPAPPWAGFLLPPVGTLPNSAGRTPGPDHAFYSRGAGRWRRGVELATGRSGRPGGDGPRPDRSGRVRLARVQRSRPGRTQPSRPTWAPWPPSSPTDLFFVRDGLLGPSTGDGGNRTLVSPDTIDRFNSLLLVLLGVDLGDSR